MTHSNASYTRQDEDSGERLDRHWSELLQELRLAQTGTQILFAFLLGIGFQSQFQAADQFTHHVYAGTLVASALAVALFLAPVSLHRIVHRQGLRDRMVVITDWLAQFGLVFLVAAMAGGVLLALDVVLSRPVALGIVTGIVVWFMLFWLVIPLVVRAKSGED
ncbi:hypothetical protein E1263_06960 [Kribbella antibiotica]|uniref:Sodium:proton antiporter n=1 Tax=Kribbella antibiotica TaxID=190195 RepID=A0A4R4ZWS8_9ACTN|nr:DUF6328 family protein [Kribbella antibiotica]TDD61622.1 hypothetical protein E1263_06960 [Kribbella antibiotica]